MENTFLTTFQASTPPLASLVVEHIVPSKSGLAFRRWHATLTQAAKQFQGYIRTDLCPPVASEPRKWYALFSIDQAEQQLKWYSITHFDAPDHLNLWLKSSEREVILESGRKIFESYQFKSFTTGFEGWFSRQATSEQSGLGPPAWKQNLAVVLGLYPTVMLQSSLFAALGILQHWSLPSAMLVNNLITSSVLTWVVMPLVTRWLNFWLQPAYLPVSTQSNLVGLLLIATLLGLMVVVFNWV